MATSLAIARDGQRRIISLAERLKQMQPIEPQAINGSNLDRARYLCEVAQFRIANGMYAAAMEALRESLVTNKLWLVRGPYYTTLIWSILAVS